MESALHMNCDVESTSVLDSLSVDDEDLREVAGSATVMRKAWRVKIAIASTAAVLLLLAPAASHHVMRGVPYLGSALDAEQKEVIEIVPPSAACSKPKINCMDTKCCAISGHQCWQKDATSAYCSERCPSNQWSCIKEENSWQKKPIVYYPGTSLFCYSVATLNLGPNLKSDKQMDLMMSQFKFKVGIFGCEGWEAFSDGDFCLDKSKNQCVTKMPDVEGEFADLTRMDKPDKYVNTPLFYQVWKALRDHGNYQYHDWTVKVDPQTVFLPERLRNFLTDKSTFKGVQTEQGNYFENCPGVESGMFGNIEVTNLKAFSVFMTQLEDCKISLCWRSTDDCKKDWKYGPWGEDKFMQACMDKNGVQKVLGFELTKSGTCPKSRPPEQKENNKYVPPCAGVTNPAVHPFRDSKSYFGCLSSITGKMYV